MSESSKDGKSVSEDSEELLDLSTEDSDESNNSDEESNNSDSSIEGIDKEIMLDTKQMILLLKESGGLNKDTKELINSLLNKNISKENKIYVFTTVFKKFIHDLNLESLDIIIKWMNEYISSSDAKKQYITYIRINNPKLGNELKEKGEGFKFLSWIGNSCYIDSVFVAIFLHPNVDIDRCFFESKQADVHLTELQTELNNIKEYIRDRSYSKKDLYCTNFRKILKANLKEFKISEKKNAFFAPHTNAMEDANEFLSFLFNRFNQGGCLDILTQKTITEGEKDGKVELIRKRKNKTFPIVFITRNNVDRDENELQGFLKIVQKDVGSSYINDSGVEYKDITTTTQYKIDNLTFLIFSIEKDDANMKKKFIPPLRIGTMSLKSIVVYTQKHFICYFTDNYEWYLYNDMQKDIEKIGSYNDLLEISRVLKRGVMYVYMI
jgi:hypothetical protein